MSNNSCYLSGNDECELTEVTIDGHLYHIDEEIADEFSLKKLKNKILEKKQEKEQEKEKAIKTITDACESLGIDKDALARLLLNKNDSVTPAAAPVAAPAAAPAAVTPENDGFREVDGTLRSNIKVNINTEEGVSGTMPAYSTVKDEEGKAIFEEGKRVKKADDDTLITKSSMGTTVIRIDHRNGNEIDKMLKQVDGDYNLIRASVSGNGHMSGNRTIDCPLCDGSGISKINSSKCPKCDGIGSILV